MDRIKKIGVASAIGGALAAVTWIASYDSLRQASFILYQNDCILPLLSTCIIMGVYVGCLLMYKYIESFAASCVDDLASSFEDEE